MNRNKTNYTENEKEYKSLMLRIGGALLIFLALFTTTQTVCVSVSPMLLTFFGETNGTVIAELLSAATYFASFMLPVFFFHMISKGKNTEPMRLMPKLTYDTPLLIIASIGIIFACSSLNGMLLQPFVDQDAFNELFADTTDYRKDYVVVLQFISVALVPGICEEFLFRGMILSNLQPYGKTGAVIASALLFGAMHQNPFQMFYATFAGIVLGVIYLYTESIWCCMLTHVMNNALSLVLSVVAARLPESLGNTVSYVIMGIVFVLASASVFLLFILWRKAARRKTDTAESGIFGKIPSVREGYMARPVSPEQKIRLFFSPTMLVFLGFVFISFITILLMVSGSINLSELVTSGKETMMQ